MSYKPNIPQANDFISISQSDMQTNFDKINSYVFQNHESFISQFAGKHRFASFTNQSVVPATGAGENILFCQDDFGTNPTSELFFRGQNLAPSDESTRLTKIPGILAKCIISFTNKEWVFTNDYNIDKINFNGRKVNALDAGFQLDSFSIYFKKKPANISYYPIIYVFSKVPRYIFVELNAVQDQGFIFFVVTSTGDPVEMAAPDYINQISILIRGDIDGT